MSLQERPDWTEGFVVRVGDYTLGRTEASPETTGYWEGVDQHELRLKHCPDCGRFLHPRRMVCSNCASTQLEWQPVPGRGQVYTFSELHRAPVPELAASVPYYLGIVRLDEGVHLFTRLLPENAPVQIG